jgi:hypothetical protein
MDKNNNTNFEDKVTKWFAANVKLVVGLLAGVLLLWGGYATYGFINEKREVKAQKTSC